MPQPTLPLNTDFGPYHLLRLIAVGGMAEVYLARTKGVAGFEKLLALKVIHPDYAGDLHFVQMLVDEAKLAVKLNHANIAQTFDLGKISGTYFISMEFVDGGDYLAILKGLTQRALEVPIEAAVYVVREVCQGLDYAHNKADANGNPLQIIHRDISPQNILLSRHGEVKLVDFGIAKAANVSGKTRAGVIKGKLVYMAPEQAWGEPVDQRTDVFSAGVVLYEALTGGSLYLEQNPVKLLEQVRKADIQPPSTVRPGTTPELDALVMKAVARDPVDRYQTARDFGAALSEYLRIIAPEYSAPQLGALVEAVLEDRAEIPGAIAPRAAVEPPPAGPNFSTARRRGRATGRAAAMDRGDFAVHGHSVIFSAEEMMESIPPLPGGGPRMRAPAKLVLLADDGPQTFELGEQFIIGRGGDLRLADGRVSRRHARIIFHDGAYLLEDLDSSNGTYLNDQKVEELRHLHAGDMIRIGPFEMRFDGGGRPSPARQSSDHAPLPPEPLREFHDETPVGDEPDALPPLIEPRAAIRSSQDRTANQQRAVVTVRLGTEQLILPVDRNLPLDHAIAVGDVQVIGVASTLIRRGDGYWLEPSSDRGTIYLNGEAVTAPKQLRPGDLLTIGPLEVVFELLEHRPVS